MPGCRADLIGYFAPHEGLTTLACGICNIANLAACEDDRKKLANDRLGRENCEAARHENPPRKKTGLS